MHIAITGHRHMELTLNGIGQRNVAELTREIHERAAKRAALGEYITLHTGGALGVDTWVAQTWQMMQVYHNGLFHKLHLPFDIDTMGRFWTLQQQRAANGVLANADALCDKCMAPTFDFAQYQKRNECMVDTSDHVIAFWTGKSGGGTWNCIKYALHVGKPVYNALQGFERIRSL